MKEKQSSFDFPDEAKVPPNLGEPPSKVKVPRESRSLCHYCGVMVPSGTLERTPTQSDATAWAGMAAYHESECRWIRTKGLRVDTDA